MSEIEKNDVQENIIKQKARRKKIRIAVIAIILIIAVVAAYLIFGKKGGQQSDAMTAVAYYGPITSMVEGNGLTKTKNTETLMLLTSGTAEEVFVTEGQHVEAGDALFTIDSPAAKSMLQNAKSNYEGYEKQLAAAKKDLAGLYLSPKYSGKLMNAVKLKAGDEVYKGEVLASLVDDRTMKLTQYYSYAYKDSFYVGQKVDVSVPSLMSVLEGKVEAVNMVSRITSEGSKLFSIEVSVQNPGVLTAGIVASASLNQDGEIVYPYEETKLEYNRVSDLKSTVSGTVVESKLLDYLEVSEGEVLVTIDAEDSDNEIFNLEKQLEDARLALERAQKNMDNCTATAPLSGKVIGLSVIPGENVAENTMLVTISDASQIIINATVDERNISYIKPGMSVQLDQWGNMCFGYVDTISWNSTINNGVATYPITIIADNPDERIQLNSYITYSITASQAESTLLVPLQAVRNAVLEDGSEAKIVYVRNADPANVVTLMWEDEIIPEGFSPVAVEIGISDNSNVEILSGINEGEEVFTQMVSTEYWG